MSALFLALWLAAAPDAGLDAPRAAPADVLGAMKRFSKPKGHEGQTACGACHVTSSWSDVRFNHERTGFPLTGRHARTSCKACHAVDFKASLPRGCAGCHRDVHAGELGARCEGCHDTADWRSRFDVDAHRRTNFPLMGAHAALPCVECHAEARERRFSRTASDCQACHQADAERTALTSPVNHVTLGLVARPCRECHTPVTYRPASFPTHDVCFPINAGVHAVPCLDCHSTLSFAATNAGRCDTRTAACSKCHERAETDKEHEDGTLPGYRYDDLRCVGCHKPMGGTP